ncbi:MAG TPA: glutathione synthase [Gammaproteobacteria bacterium]|jgi:glutathione synthase|nr:glutathione synthase [Gammaproteobacteria bacterium]
MRIKVGVVMDPIDLITPKKDTTLAMLLAVQRRGWEICYMELGDIVLRDGHPYGYARNLLVEDSIEDWYEFASARRRLSLADLDVVLMRKDPPFDTDYIFATYILEQAQARGCLVVNDPRALRDANEKLFTAWFNDVCPSTLVTRDTAEIRRFGEECGDIIVKPLDGMGGASIFRVTSGDVNASVIYETLTEHDQRFCMAQKYIPEIAAGDKRILMIDGEPIPYALARIPSAGELRGNLAAGGRGRGQALSARDREICACVGPELKSRGLIFVGLDVIGDYLTEINVTSPTCMRELEAEFDIAIGDQLMECIAGRLEA